MGHDATKVLLGSTPSSDKSGTNVYDSSPLTFLAGTAVRLGSDGLLTTTKGSNKWVGISLGKSLSDVLKTCVLRAGSRVPVRLALKRAFATVEITSYANLLANASADKIVVGATEFVAQSGAASLGDATFRASSSNAATATSLALQINSHATAGALVRAYAVGAVVTVMAIVEGAAGNESIAIAYSDEDIAVSIGATVSDDDSGELAGGSDDIADVDYPVIGANAYIDDVNGKATQLTYKTTVSDAIYASEVLTGIAEDGSSVPVALVDMVGGL